MLKRQNRVSQHIDFLTKNFRIAENKEDPKGIKRNLKKINRCCEKLMKAHTDYFNDIADGRYQDGEKAEMRPEFIMAKVHNLSAFLIRKHFHLSSKSTSAIASANTNQKIKEVAKQPQP